MELKYDVSFILGLFLVLAVLIVFNLNEFLEYAVYMFCLISYYVGKFVAKKVKAKSS